MGKEFKKVSKRLAEKICKKFFGFNVDVFLDPFTSCYFGRSGLIRIDISSHYGKETDNDYPVFLLQVGNCYLCEFEFVRGNIKKMS